MHEQNMAILKSLVAVAWADGRVADEEREVIEALLQAFDANEAECTIIREYSAEPKTLDDIPITELDTDDRRVLLQHAVLLTYIDGEQDEKERALLEVLAERLRIRGEEREQLMGVASERAKRFLNLLLAEKSDGFRRDQARSMTSRAQATSVAEHASHRDRAGIDEKRRLLNVVGLRWRPLLSKAPWG